MEAQPGDPFPGSFYFLNREPLTRQKSCYITYTNPTVHNLGDNLADSPIYNRQIQSAGPRYCPSIEDKVHRFSEKEHQNFVEPEGWHTMQIYVNGLSTSVPEAIQVKMLRGYNWF